MKLFRLSQTEVTGYDIYSDCVVCAKDKEQAKRIHPSKYVTHWREGKWFGTYDNLARPDIHGKEYDGETSSWVSGDQIRLIKVEYLGKATRGIKKGVVCASFHAG